MSEIAKPKRGRKDKRSEGEKKRFISESLKWLKGHLASTEIKDHEKVILTSLILNWLFTADDYCAPSDAELGASCGKSEDAAQRTTHGLGRKGIITKAKLIGRSFYGFIGLTIPGRVQELQFPDVSRNNSWTHPGNNSWTARGII